MLDIRFVKENPELVKENIRKKFKDSKLPLVDQAIALHDEKLAANKRADELRANRNKISKEIGMLMGKGLREEAEAKKKLVAEQAEELKALGEKETELEAALREVMLKIPNIVDDSVPVGKDDSENVEVEQFGEHLIGRIYIQHPHILLFQRVAKDIVRFHLTFCPDLLKRRNPVSLEHFVGNVAAEFLINDIDLLLAYLYASSCSGPVTKKASEKLPISAMST